MLISQKEGKSSLLDLEVQLLDARKVLNPPLGPHMTRKAINSSARCVVEHHFIDALYALTDTQWIVVVVFQGL